MERMAQRTSAYEKKFFASSNSSKGFHNDFPHCFGETGGVSLLYVVIGGPGTGKSHLMRAVGRSAEKQGYDVTYFCCSSDPASLDGVRLEAPGKPCIGVIDGTAPHPWPPTLPGVREETVDLSRFWNGTILRRHREQIKILNQKKAECYEAAYRYLGACGEVTAAVDMAISPLVDRKRLVALAKRLLRNQPSGRDFSPTVAHLRCVGMTGCAYFDTYEQMAMEVGGEIICVEQAYGLGHMLMSELFRAAQRQALAVFISRDPIHTEKIDGLFFPNSGLCILTKKENTPPSCRLLSLKRYLDIAAFREIRGEVRHDLKLAEDLKAGAIRRLKKAGEYHFALEQIYASAMDFDAKESFEKEFCRKLFR